LRFKNDSIINCQFSDSILPPTNYFEDPKLLTNKKFLRGAGAVFIKIAPARRRQKKLTACTGRLAAAGAGVTAGWFCPGQYSLNNSGCTTDTGFYFNGVSRAVLGAGAAFHAGVPVQDDGFFFPHPENRVRTNNRTHPTSRAFIGVQF